MKILILTNMYPNDKQPYYGTFVKDQIDALIRAGVDVDVVFINGRRNKFDYILGILRFWRKLLQNRYDVIHAHYAITGIVARLQFSYPVVVTYHGGEMKNFSPFWIRFPARYGPRLFDRIIAVSKEQQEILKHHSKIRLIPCGIDLNKFQPMPIDEARRILSLPLDKPLVLWAGQYWQWEKRFELVETSMKTLKQHIPEAKLIVVSGQPYTVIPLYMNACDVLLLTSRSEGSPMVIKEAMACNLPIVSTKVGDVAQVIKGTYGCYLVEPNVKDIVEKLVIILNSKQRTNGRKKIKSLSNQIIVQHIINVYKELLI